MLFWELNEALYYKNRMHLMLYVDTDSFRMQGICKLLIYEQAILPKRDCVQTPLQYPGYITKDSILIENFNAWSLNNVLFV